MSCESNISGVFPSLSCTVNAELSGLVEDTMFGASIIITTPTVRGLTLLKYNYKDLGGLLFFFSFSFLLFFICKQPFQVCVNLAACKTPIAPCGTNKGVSYLILSYHPEITLRFSTKQLSHIVHVIKTRSQQATALPMQGMLGIARPDRTRRSFVSSEDCSWTLCRAAVRIAPLSSSAETSFSF